MAGLDAGVNPHGTLTYKLTSANTTAGTITVGKLPAGYAIRAIEVFTAVAGTGSSSPTFSVGISGTTAKYKADGALTVTAGYVAYTVAAGGALPTTADETILITTTGTLPTNATYDARVVMSLVRTEG
jgi:hypothetical protein